MRDINDSLLIDFFSDYSEIIRKRNLLGEDISSIYGYLLSQENSIGLSMTIEDLDVWIKEQL